MIRVEVNVVSDTGKEDIRIEVEHPNDLLPVEGLQTMIQRAANAAQAYLDQPDDVVVSDPPEYQI